MVDRIDSMTEAAKALSEVVRGPDTPESVKVVQRDDRLKVWIKGLSGPAVSLMLIGFALLAADWIPIFGKQGIWTAGTEQIRAQGVVVALIVLSACVGLVLWVAHAGRPSRTEIKAGPASLVVEQDEGDGR